MMVKEKNIKKNGGDLMRVKEFFCQECISIDTGYIVKNAKHFDFSSYTVIRIGIENMQKYSIESIVYVVQNTRKTNAESIASFIGQNRGKKLLDILEMNVSG